MCLDGGWTVEATAERFQVDAKTVRKWRDRFLAEGRRRAAGPVVAAASVARTGRRERLRRRVLRAAPAAPVGCRPHRVRGRPGRVDGAAASCTHAGLGRLDRGDRATDTEPVRRYQRDRPGELIHVDVKKIAAIPDGGGWRIHGRGNDGHHGHAGAGYRYIHTALDDRTRLVYSEIHADEQAATAAGFWSRAAAWFSAIGHHPRTSHHRQRLLLPLRALAPGLRRDRHRR